MAYIFYTVMFVFFISATLLYFTRDRWLDYVPIPEYIYSRLPSSFANDIEDGLTSDEFDLTGNLIAGDTRAGLDPQSKREVKKIMHSKRVGFDEARRIYNERRFAKNNIGPDGRPQDPKFVSFS